MASPTDSQQARLTEDDRFDLQFAAASAERRNQPRLLVLLAGAFLAISLLGVVFGNGRVGRAERAIASKRAAATEIQFLLEQLEREEEEQGVTAWPPNSRAKLEIQQATRGAGLADVPEPTLRQGMGNTLGNGARRVAYEYRGLRSYSIEILFAAIQASLRAVPGLEVYEIQLKPGDTEWEMTVVYSRIERSS